MIARWGIAPILVATAILAWGVWVMPEGLPRWIALGVAIALWSFIIFFFRNPQRTAPAGDRLLIAPADGVVWDVEELPEPEVIGGPAVRIGIFLSVFDVHVNRSPCAGTVTYANYRPGRFLDVRHPDCPNENEANTLGIAVDPAVAPSLTIVVRQLAGLIARRIVCTHGVGDRLGRCELYGMIRFGSRTEVWIPKSQAHRVLVQKGQRVRCGETPIAEILA